MDTRPKTAPARLKKPISKATRILIRAATTAMGVALLLGAPATGWARPVVHVIDVGYGSAVHVEDGARHYLFDTGPREAASRILQHLGDQRVTRLSAIVLSHGHADHAGGLFAIVRQIPTDRVFWNGVFPEDEFLVGDYDRVEERTPFEELLPGDERVLGRNVTLRVLNTGAVANTNLNDGSLVVGLEVGRLRLLFPGDIGKPAQDNLAGAHAEWLAGLTWMLWPHHGDFLAPAFMEAIRQADVCVLSIGDNPYGLPWRGFDRQAAALCKSLHRTDKAGTLSFAIDRRRIIPLTQQRPAATPP